MSSIVLPSVIGAGAAGVGVGHDTVGASFERWPAETRFITPSFPTNSIGMLDLNSVALGTSPAITLGAEHPTGAQYAEYLFRLAKFFELPICANTDVQSVQKVDDEFHIEVAEGTVRAKHLIWAAGEFQYPRLDGVAGAQHCVHTATVERYDGIDAAYHLAKRGKHVRLFDSGCPWRTTLSTFSQERMSDRDFTEYVTLEPYTKIAAVQTSDDGFTVSTLDGVQFETDVAPLFAGGFHGSHQMVAHLFETREDGFPLLNDDDESTITPGLFLCGPAVRHGNQSFCFIYKFRQRFLRCTGCGACDEPATPAGTSRLGLLGAQPPRRRP